jgi:uncharacterized protein involved in exopolysaccharide biosynthesis
VLRVDLVLPLESGYARQNVARLLHAFDLHALDAESKTMPPQNQSVDGELVDDEERSASAVAPEEIASFVFRTARARVRLAATIFASVAALTVVANVFLPRTYHTDVRIHAQGQAAVIRAFSNPGRTLPDIESPTKGASETLLRRDSLIKIVRDARLVERWEAEREAVLRIKDAIVFALAPRPTSADKEAAIIGTLEKKLTVVGEDQAVNIGVDWSNADTAYEIVVVAQKTFIDSRRAVEVAVISDAIALIDARAREQRPVVDAALKDMADAYDAAKGKKPAGSSPPLHLEAAVVPAPAPVVAPVPQPASAPVKAPEPDKELIEKLAEKRRAISELEQTRTRRIAELRAQIDEQRTTLGAAHPTLIASEKRLEAMTDEPADLIAMRNEERTLLRQVSAEAKAVAQAPRSAQRSLTPLSTAHAGSPSGDTEAGNGLSRLDEDPQVAFTRGHFDVEVRKYEELMTNLDAARAELDNAKAAFKYRYSVARPAERPRNAVKPKPALVLGFGFGLAVLLGLLVPAALRLLTGRVQEPWQVRTQLKLPVLGEVKLPSK